MNEINTPVTSYKTLTDNKGRTIWKATFLYATPIEEIERLNALFIEWKKRK